MLCQVISVYVRLRQPRPGYDRIVEVKTGEYRLFRIGLVKPV